MTIPVPRWGFRAAGFAAAGVFASARKPVFAHGQAGKTQNHPNAQKQEMVMAVENTQLAQNSTPTREGRLSVSLSSDPPWPDTRGPLYLKSYLA